MKKLTEDEQRRWVLLLTIWRDAYQGNPKLFCTKRFQWMDDGFHSDFCEECWNLYMFEHYWLYGLGKYRIWCLADNCVNKDTVEFVLQEHPEWRDKIGEG